MSRVVYDAVTELESLARQLETDAAGDTHTTGVQAGITWGARCARERAADLRAAAPAEDWEPVTADQVRVGDEIEFVQVGVTIRGVVHKIFDSADSVVSLGAGRMTFCLDEEDCDALRRRVRQPLDPATDPVVVDLGGAS